jgi:hypothetical protein
VANKSEADVALEVFQSVRESREQQKKLRSSTFWKLFDVKARQGTVVERIVRLLEKHNLRVGVRGGKPLGDEDAEDWIELSMTRPPRPPTSPRIPVRTPSPEWFVAMQTRIFESEGEVEAYFVVPLLESLGYAYDDVCIGLPVQMYRGVKRTTAEADFVAFDGVTRDKKDVLLLIEAKKPGKGISVDHIGQAESYADVLMPACYIITDSQEIKVFEFNGGMSADECVMDFPRSDLQARWDDLYRRVSKEAASKRKDEMPWPKRK